MEIEYSISLIVNVKIRLMLIIYFNRTYIKPLIILIIIPAIVEGYHVTGEKFL